MIPRKSTYPNQLHLAVEDIADESYSYTDGSAELFCFAYSFVVQCFLDDGLRVEHFEVRSVCLEVGLSVAVSLAVLMVFHGPYLGTYWDQPVVPLVEHGRLDHNKDN